MPLGSWEEGKKHKQKTNMFAFIFQITIYAGTNEHSERGSYCIIVGEDVKLHAEWKEQKGDSVQQSKLFLWRLPERHHCWFI